MLEILKYEFMRNAIIAGIFASIALGIIGTYVIVKRIVFISGGISHSSFGGIGLAYYLSFDPILGAMIFAIASALSIGIISKKTKQREDTAIGILWASGMAIGIIFISFSSSYAPDLFSYLFGNIITVPSSDIYILLILDIFIVAIVYIFYKEFLAISFDEEFAKVVAVPTLQVYLLLLFLIGLTVVMLIRIVGVILVIALLTIPPAISGQYAHELKKMMFYSIILGLVIITSGLWLSYELNLPTGATIVIVGCIAFIISSFYKKLGEINVITQKN